MRYRNVTFRSTLEADWAYNLDRYGISWEYEPEAFQLPSGDYYRPDFYLPHLTTWLEVKGPHNERIGKVRELAEAALHSPECEAIRSAWPTVHLSTYSDASEANLLDQMVSWPSGTTQVVVNRSRIERGDPWNGDATYTHLGTARPKRRVLVPADLNWYTNDPGCCGYNWGQPWRLTVIGRSPVRGRLTFEAGYEHHQVSLSTCSACGTTHFHEESGGWQCRGCGIGGKDARTGACNESGDLEFHKVPREGHR